MRLIKIGIPKTVGQLKRMLELYPDDSILNFRNQPPQTLYETKDNGEYLLFFQLDENQGKFKIN